MNIGQLVEAFERWRRAGSKLVLATVYDTEGSTYSKAGAQMLIDADGNFQGMLSGGCLEGDLAERAAAVLATGEPAAVTYDLGSRDEELWGLGVGCDGLMRIFLQALGPADDYRPFSAMAAAYAGERAGAAATVIGSTHPQLPAGSAWLAGEAIDGLPAGARGPLNAGLERVLGGADAACESLDVDGQPVTLLFARLAPPPRVLVLGGGLDAQPVVRLIAGLGWRVVVQDHRPAYLARGDFEPAEEIHNLRPEEIGASLDLGRYDAAIVMSHHLDSDRHYLAALAESDMAYIGLLGPVDRRRRLVADLGDRAARLEGRLHGPAGLDLGGRGPAAIALSIVAELHGRLVGGAGNVSG